MKRRQILIYLFWGFIAILIVAGCRRTPLPAPTPMPTLAEVAAAPTDTPTPVPPTPTPAPTDTPTPTFTPLPTDTPTPTPTPTPVLLLSPADFSPDRNPLTGELAADPSALQRRPLAVKIANNPPEFTRPQHGLSQADLVFEHVTEGAITRFTAIFYSQAPPDIGPIRSGRLVDIELPAMYDAALIFSGAHPGVSQRMFRSDFSRRILRSHELGYYRTDSDKPWEHRLHGDPAGFWQVLAERGENRAPQFSSFMAFSSQPPPGGQPASYARIDYRNWTVGEWRYDAGNGRYWRWSDGEPLTDANNDQQISAANVVIIFALHQLDRSICTFHQDGVCTGFPTEIQIWGRGRGVILRDGWQYPVTWKRENRSDMFTFYDADDNPVPLQIGNTWFQIVPLHYTDPVTIGEEASLQDVP